MATEAEARVGAGLLVIRKVELIALIAYTSVKDKLRVCKKSLHVGDDVVDGLSVS